jgi:hypothetical protein
MNSTAESSPQMFIAASEFSVVENLIVYPLDGYNVRGSNRLTVETVISSIWGPHGLSEKISGVDE